MNWTSQEENKLKQYWLAELPEAERQQIEERLIEDDKYDQLARVIEQELIDDYARGALSAPDQALFERDFPLTPERQRLLWLARQAVAVARQRANTTPSETGMAVGRGAARAEKPNSRWWQFRFTPIWQWGALAALLLSVGLGVWWWRGRAPEMATKLAGTRAVIERVAPRTYEPRLSQLSYATYVIQMGDVPREPQIPALEQEENRLRLQLRQQPDAATLYALGQVHLARKQLEAARGEFNRALRQSAEEEPHPSLSQPYQAQLHNDLGVTLLELWSRERSRGETPQVADLQQQSLEQFVRALKLDERLLEARFNQALLYERAGQTPEARAAWDDYLARESDPEWKSEAQAHRNALK